MIRRDDPIAKRSITNEGRRATVTARFNLSPRNPFGPVRHRIASKLKQARLRRGRSVADLFARLPSEDLPSQFGLPVNRQLQSGHSSHHIQRHQPVAGGAGKDRH